MISTWTLLKLYNLKRKNKLYKGRSEVEQSAPKCSRSGLNIEESFKATSLEKDKDVESVEDIGESSNKVSQSRDLCLMLDNN